MALATLFSVCEKSLGRDARCQIFILVKSMHANVQIIQKHVNKKHANMSLDHSQLCDIHLNWYFRKCDTGLAKMQKKNNKMNKEFTLSKGLNCLAFISRNLIQPDNCEGWRDIPCDP